MSTGVFEKEISFVLSVHIPANLPGVPSVCVHRV
jgi:hypothetical protein